VQEEGLEKTESMEVWALHGSGLFVQQLRDTIQRIRKKWEARFYIEAHQGQRLCKGVVEVFFNRVLGLLLRSSIVNSQSRRNNRLPDMKTSEYLPFFNFLARALKTKETPILTGYQIFHNYIRTHEGLDGKTPSEACGITIQGNNKWLTLIQNASKEK
jgi:hypothetical protein